MYVRRSDVHMLLCFALAKLVILHVLNGQQCSIIIMFFVEVLCGLCNIRRLTDHDKDYTGIQYYVFLLVNDSTNLDKGDFYRVFFLHDGNYYHSPLSVLVYILTLDSMLSDNFLQHAYKTGKN